MRTHVLKIREPYFSDILNGLKTFEIRKNDRNYKVGDRLTLQLYPYSNDITKEKELSVEITYILKDIPEYGLDKDYCILGFKPKSLWWSYGYTRVVNFSGEPTNGTTNE